MRVSIVAIVSQRKCNTICAEMRSNARQWLRRVGIIALGVFLGLFLGWLAIRGTDWGQVGNAIAGIPLSLLVLALAFFVTSTYFRAVRWRLFWTKERVSVLRLFWIENAALGLNNITPVRALAEPVEFGILALRDRLPGGTIVATMVMRRIHDLAFTILFVAVAIIALPSLLRFTPAIILSSLYLFAWLAVLLNMGRVVRRFSWLRLVPGMASFEHAVGALRVRKWRMAAAFTTTWLYWLLLGPMGWAVAKGVGIDLGLHQLLFIVLGSIFFSTSVPGLPGAVGTFQFAVVSLMDIWGIPREAALSFAIVVHIILFLSPTIIAVFVLPREGVRSVRALREMIGTWRARQA